MEMCTKNENKINKIMWKESDWEVAIIIIVIKEKQD